MKKSLLFGMMALCSSLSGYAFDAGEYVYAPQGRFKIASAENLCTNGTCAANFDGWTVMSATATSPDEVFQYDVEKQSFYSKTNVHTEGMYYKFNIANASGTYIVSFKLRQETAAWPYSTNILTATDGGVNTYGIQYADHNFVNLFGNSGGFTSSENFVSYGKELQFTPDWQTVTFAIEGDGTPRDYYLAFAGLNTTVEISDVQIQEAEPVRYADLRKRDAALAYAQAIVNAKEEWDDPEGLLDALNDNIVAVQEIGDENSQTDLDDVLVGLDEALTTADGQGFLDKCLDNYIATCADGTDWAKRTFSTGKLQKQKTMGDWTFGGSCADRGFSQDGEDLCGVKDISWWELGHFMYGNALGEGSMSMKKTLAAGVYVFSMEASGATRYDAYGAKWYYNLGFAPFDFELYINDAEGNVVKNNVVAATTNAYAKNFVVVNIETAGDYEIGAKMYPRVSEYYGTLGKLGYGYFFKNPRIYCKLSGTHTADELKYIENVKAQIEAMNTAYTAAQALYDNKEYPWLKAEMADTIAKYKAFLDVYQALSDDDIFNGFVDPVVGKENSGYANYIDGEDPETGDPIPTYNAIDTVMVNAVKPLLRYNEAYTAANKVFTDLNDAIATAKAVKAQPVYSVATGMQALTDAIAKAENAYTQLATNGSYTVGAEENPDYDAVVAAKEELNAAVEEFKTSIPADKVATLADIDFSSPAVAVEGTANYAIAGTVGSMEIDNYSTETNNTSYTQGLDVNEVKEAAEVLRVGNGNGVVAIDPADYAGKIVRITFDFYFGNLTKSSTGFYLKDAASENVAALYYSPYDRTITANTFGFDIDKFPRIGSSGGNDNLKIYDEAKNKSSFELVLNYATANKTMYASTASALGTQTTEPVAISGDFTQFVLASNYSNADRRSWFDNLKIETIEYDPTGIAGVNEVSESADEAIYNVAGQKVSAPVKGQIYVKKGAAFVK